MKDGTLCVLYNKEKDQVLLAMKKRGFGVNLWNAPGGKIEPGETPEQNAIRETKEEINVKVTKTKPAGIMTFYFPDEKFSPNWKVYIFRALSWEGEPQESEEMQPRWFKVSELPFDQMWPDDYYWLPPVIEDKSVEAEFYLDNNKKLLSHKIKIIPT